MLYLHVGLHKTGTTYFQGEVFPRWTGIRYLKGLTVENLLKLDPDQVCLGSREGLSGGVVAHQHEKLDFLKRLSVMFPDARILLSLRRHGSYLNAIYSQFLRYGGTLRPDEFFNLESDGGYIKQADLHFQAYIDGITEYWGNAPFVFLLEELKQDKRRLFSEMATFFGVPAPSLGEMASARRNVSLGRRQAEALRRINQLSGVSLHRDGSTRPYRVLRRFGMDPPSLCQRWSAMGSNEPVISRDQAQRIDAFFEDDWSYVLSCMESRLHQITDMQIPVTPALQQ